MGKAISAMMAAVVLAGCAGGPAGLRAPLSDNQPREVRLISAIERQGCVLTPDNVGQVLLAANLTQADLVEITPQLAQAGRAEVATDGNIRVMTERCI